jgi:hypothetical protein
MAEPDGTFQAYEYTVDPIQDVSKQQVDFLKHISREIFRLGVERVFALAVLEIDFFEEFVEFEVSQLQATIALRPLIWLPQYKGAGQEWESERNRYNTPTQYTTKVKAREAGEPFLI